MLYTLYSKTKFHSPPFTIDESLKAIFHQVTMVNEQWRNHSGPTKRRRKPNGPPSHNTLISASSESVLQLSSLFFCVALCWSHIFFVAQFSLTHRNNSWSTTHNEPSLEEHGIVHAYTYSATSLATSGCNSKANNFGSNYIVNCQ